MKLAIPSACHEDWQEMQPVQGGRHCSHCQKTVVDFTAMPDNEILMLLQEKKAVCGRFNHFQLNRELNPPVKKHWPWALFMGLTALGVETSAKSSPGIVCVPAEKKDARQTADTGRIIKGYVKDGDVKMPGAAITIKGDGVRIGTSTNNEGYFMFKIPESIQGDSVELQVAYLGYITQYLTVSLSNPDTVCIRMDMNSNSTLTGDVIIIRRANFWQRLKRKLKH